MKTLIPLSDFVLEQLKIEQSTSEFKEVVRDYTKFLRQPLEMGMFYPIHEGTPVRPFDEDAYDIALQKVLFKGWKDGDRFEGNCFTEDFIIEYSRSYNTYVLQLRSYEDANNEDYAILYTIEDLLKRPFGLDWDAFSENFELTPSALKAIGVKE